MSLKELDMREYLNQPHTSNYTFRHTTADGKTTELSHEIDDAATWPNAVEAFLSFLEIVYGYPIKQDVLYDVDIYMHDMLTTNRLVYTNWQPKDEDKDPFIE
jgi:hypothetical protein